MNSEHTYNRLRINAQSALVLVRIVFRHIRGNETEDILIMASDLLHMVQSHTTRSSEISIDWMIQIEGLKD